ncbi:hypothetical protein KAI65_05820 [Candidatus Parcubacteria bacterium]|nr:hypothetical protein [Candidatus Parcubacteria bacterium]
MENLNLQPDSIDKRDEPKIDPDTKFLNGLVRLENEQKIIEEKINQAKGDEKKILEMNLDDIKKQVKAYKFAFKKYRSTKKINNLKKETGEDNVVDMLNFKNKKDNSSNKIDGIEENLLNDLEDFKKRKTM